MSWFRRRPEPPKLRFRLHPFKPMSDITTYELATIVGNTWSLHGSALSEGLYLPAEKTAEQHFQDEYGMPELARHFLATEQIDEFPASWF